MRKLAVILFLAASAHAGTAGDLKTAWSKTFRGFPPPWVAGIVRQDSSDGVETYRVLLRTEWDSFELFAHGDGTDGGLASLRYSGAGFIGRSREGVVIAGGDLTRRSIWLARSPELPLRTYPMPETPTVMGGCPTPDGGVDTDGRVVGVLARTNDWEVGGVRRLPATAAPAALPRSH